MLLLRGWRTPLGRMAKIRGARPPFAGRRRSFPVKTGGENPPDRGRESRGINRGVSLGSLEAQPRCCGVKQMAEPGNLSIKLRAALGSQPIGLLFPRCILQLKALDPSIVKEPVNRPVERPGTEL